MGPQNYRQGLNKMDSSRLHPLSLSVVLKHHHALEMLVSFPPLTPRCNCPSSWKNFELGKGIDGGEREKREGEKNERRAETLE